MPAPKDPAKYEEWKRKVRIPLLGRKPSEKTIARLIERNKKFKMSDAHKEKLKLSHKGKKPWNWKGGYAWQKNNAPRPRPTNCEICSVVVARGKGKEGVCYDHDHATGKFRGWICINCNFILGHAHDNTEVLRKIIIYLENHAFNQ